MVVLLLALLIRPIVGSYPRFHNQLVPLARMLRNRITDRAKGYELDGQGSYATSC